MLLVIVAHVVGFFSSIHAAEKRLWIASPYFVPDESNMNSLHLAALRGVDVRILIPASRIVSGAAGETN